jgi:hypothetical protein
MLEVLAISTIIVLSRHQKPHEPKCIQKWLFRGNVVLTPKSITRAPNTVQSTQINQQDCHDVHCNIYSSKLPNHNHIHRHFQTTSLQEIEWSHSLTDTANVTTPYQTPSCPSASPAKHSNGLKTVRQLEMSLDTSLRLKPFTTFGDGDQTEVPGNSISSYFVLDEKFGRGKVEIYGSPECAFPPPYPQTWGWLRGDGSGVHNGVKALCCLNRINWTRIGRDISHFLVQ